MARKVITYTATLVYHDGVQVFEAKDRIGGSYVAIAVDEDASGEPLFAVVGVPPTQLQQFRLGKIDLLTLVSSESSQGWLAGALENSDTGVLQVNAEEMSGALPADYLPEKDFHILMPFAEGSDTLVRQEAARRGNLALAISVESPIPSDEHRLRVDDYSGLLFNIQSLVKHAYRKRISMIERIKRTFDSLSPLLDVVVPAATGSFKFVLVPAQQPGLFGGSDVSYGLEVIDYLLGNANDPKDTLGRLQAYSGHTASAFVRLIRFMVEHNLAVKYTWASPASDEVTTRIVTQREAITLLEMLSATESLATERFSITGRLTKIDVKSETWRLDATDSSESYTGKVRSGVSLDGLIAGHLYRFDCEEVIEEVAGTGREIRTIFLASPAEDLERSK